MTHAPDRRRGRRARPSSIVRRRQHPVQTLVVGAAAGVLVATAVGDTAPRASAPAATAAPLPPVVTAAPSPPVVSAGPGTPAGGAHAQPVELKITSIGVSSRLVDLGLAADGTVQAPADYRVAGWYAAGPAPGAAGGPPAVIAGHVDSATGPAVFYKLRDLHAGDDIAIRGIDGVTRHFKVYRLADYSKQGFPAAEVYAPTEKAEVRLITCSGQFDRRQGNYLDNLVAYAVLMEPGG